MFRRLFLNTVFSGAAFLVAGLIGLIIVPILIKAYGIALFGLIVLARMLLPTGVLALFDFGFSEIAAQSVARARETGEWLTASRDVSLLIFGAAGVGAILALGLFWLAPYVGDIFRIDSSQRESFLAVVRVTGLALLVMFPALVFEGIVKGFENYAIVRAAEVFGTLVYATVAVGLAYGGFGYDTVAYAFLCSMLLRYALLLVAAYRLGVRHELRLRKSDMFANVREIAGRCRQMAASRLIGVLQSQAPVPVLGVLLGPSAVGVYDVLARLPRFAKSVIGLLNSALLPVAARIEASDDVGRMRSLGTWGVIVSSFVALPPLATVALFSEPLLRLWVGHGFSGLWGWHAFMLVIPAASALVGFGATSLLVRPMALSKLNRGVALQVVLQYVLSFGFAGIWGERAFIFGQSVAAILGFPWLMLIVAREQQLPVKDIIWLLVKIGVLGMVLGISYWFIGPLYTISGWASLVTYASVWCTAYWLAVWLVVFDASQRCRLTALVLQSRNRAVVTNGM